MAKKLVVIAIAFLTVISAKAQVISISSDFFNPTSYSIEAEVLDSLNKEPISFASVYIKNVKDTIITNFSLTDTLGKVKLQEVTKGEYNFYVEYLGYKPYIRKFYIRKNMTLPQILLQPDNQALDAARISAVGNPVEFKQDTIIYNASSFHSLAGDKLADLLKKMPGIEVGDDGQVKVNGKSVSKITVGGKTFFMGDNRAALDNLPAQFVDKVKVVDKDSEETEDTGIKQLEKETVMDVELKEEYKKGFFGNLKLAGGTPFTSKGANEFADKEKFLYDASAMLAAYGEKSQLTTIANAKNTTADGMSGMLMYDDGMGSIDLNLGMDGILDSWSVGANYNTDKIKGMETNASALFNNDHIRKHNRIERVNFSTGTSGELTDNSDETGSGTLNALKINVKMENKDKSKAYLRFRPVFSYKKLNDSYTKLSTSSIEDMQTSRSSSFSATSSELYTASGSISGGLKDLWGKKGRSISLSMNYSFQNMSGVHDDVSTTDFANSESQVRDLHHLQGEKYTATSANFTYGESFGEKWQVHFQENIAIRNSGKDNDAFNRDGTVNDWFSSITDNSYKEISSRLLAQYTKGKTYVQLGGNYRTVNNSLNTRAYGLDTKTGYGEWQHSVSPYIFINQSVKNLRINLYFFSNFTNPSASNLVPTFNIINPTRLSLGNIYLKPSLQNYGYININGRIKSSTVSLFLNCSQTKNEALSAVWFDKNSIRYSIPVNSKKPSYLLNANINLTVPLNKEKTVSLSYNSYVSHRISQGYQARTVLDAIEPEGFNYKDFIAEFWGNSSGNIFYSGASGFAQSLTITTSIHQSLILNLNFDKFRMRPQVVYSGNVSKYSLDPRANTNSYNLFFRINPQYTTPHEFELSTSLQYIIRRGFGYENNRNRFDIDLSVSKNIKNIALALRCFDLLDNNDDVQRRASENYYENSYRLFTSRRIIFAVIFNFGKSNAANSSRARNASIDMIF